MHSALVSTRIRCVQAINIGQKDECIRHDQLSDTRGKAVIVTVADLFSRNGIVLINNGYYRAFDQFTERTTSI